MREMESKLNRRFKEESDDLLFNGIQFDDTLRHNVLRQVKAEKAGIGAGDGIGTAEAASPSEAAVASPKTGGRTQAPRRRRLGWMYGSAAALLLMVAAVASPMLRDSADPGAIGVPGATAPGTTNPGSSGGISTSLLTTVTVQTPQEALERFGADLLVPTVVPERFELTHIEATGVAPDVTRVVFFYKAGDEEMIFMADRSEAVIPFDMFRKIEVNGVGGYVFPQPNMTELFWQQDGIQFSVSGSLNQDEALQMAESLAAPGAN